MAGPFCFSLFLLPRERHHTHRMRTQQVAAACESRCPWGLDQPGSHASGAITALTSPSHLTSAPPQPRNTFPMGGVAAGRLDTAHGRRAHRKTGLRTRPGDGPPLPPSCSWQRDLTNDGDVEDNPGPEPGHRSRSAAPTRDSGAEFMRGVRSASFVDMRSAPARGAQASSARATHIDADGDGEDAEPVEEEGAPLPPFWCAHSPTAPSTPKHGLPVSAERATSSTM